MTFFFAFYDFYQENIFNNYPPVGIKYVKSLYTFVL